MIAREQARAQLRARLGLPDTEHAPQRRELPPILAALHDTDYERMARIAYERIADLEPAELTALWLASMPDGLADAPWYTIARVLEGRVWELEEHDATTPD